MTNSTEPPTPIVDQDRASRESAGLRGELRSILALYCLGAILPILLGLTFGPEIL